MNIPEKLLTKLICSQCNELLSILPIHSYENGDLVCGRCPLILNNKPRRDVAYEIVAEALMYPCTYKSSGCLEIYCPAKLQQHEYRCYYRKWKCPRGSCNWKGLIRDLKKHHLQRHLFIDDSKSFNVSMENHDWNQNILKQISNNLFLIELKKRDLQLLVNIHSLQDLSKCAQDYKMCTVNIALQNEASSVSLGQLSVHDYTFDIRKTYVHNICMCAISITNMNDLNEDSNNLNKVDKYISKQVECPICLEHMSAPIYQCPVGHVICNSCKLKVPNCPQCREKIGDTRNLILEGIAENINYQCNNKGCGRVCSFQELKKHVCICKYAPYQCPLKKCKFKNDYNEFFQHLKVKHGTKICENFLTRDKRFKNSGSDVVLKSNSVFLVTHSLMQHLLNIKITRIGPRNIPNNFSFILTVEDEDNEQIEFKGKCLDWNALGTHDNSRSIQLPLLKLNPYCVAPNGWSYIIRIIENVQ